MTRLSSKHALTLYGLVVTFVFVAFVLGLLIGTGSVERPEVHPANSTFEPVEDLDEPLNFYEELSKPLEDLKPKPEIVIMETDSQLSETGGKEKTTAVVESGTEQFTIQVAAYSTRDEADQLLLRLRSKNFEGRIREPEPSNGNTYYRVWVGEFSSIGEAEVKAAQLKEEGFHTYIRRIH